VQPVKSKTTVAGAVYVVGRVLIGPKKVRGGYARIVSEKDGAGCIESFDVATQTWSKAPESVTFSDVWSAPLVPPSDWALIRDKS
jgi:hypothetical protein